MIDPDDIVFSESGHGNLMNSSILLAADDQQQPSAKRKRVGISDEVRGLVVSRNSIPYVIHVHYKPIVHTDSGNVACALRELLQDYGQLQITDITRFVGTRTLYAFVEESPQAITETVFAPDTIINDKNLSNLWVQEACMMHVSTPVESDNSLERWSYNISGSDAECAATCLEYISEESVLELLAHAQCSLYELDEFDQRSDLRLERVEIPDVQRIDWAKIVFTLCADCLINISGVSDELIDKSTLGDLYVDLIQNVPCRHTTIDELLYIPERVYPEVDFVRNNLLKLFTNSV